MGEGVYSPREGWGYLSQGGEQCHPSQALSPSPSLRGACRDSPSIWVSEGPCIVCLHERGVGVEWGFSGGLSYAFASLASPDPEQGHAAAGRHSPEHVGEHSPPA